MNRFFRGMDGGTPGGDRGFRSPVPSREPVGPGGRSPGPCCGEIGSPGPAAPCHEGFVDGRVDTPAGPVPRVKTTLGAGDVMGRWRMRWGVGRSRYRVAPRLYAVGEPDRNSAVLVTANYKMTFDALRRELEGRNVWILALDTRGINVWCAAGKGTFGTEEVVRRVGQVRLEEVVSHRRLVLPQLAAPGVSAHRVAKACGFSVVYGPVRASDLPGFLDAGMRATPRMRRVRFPLTERISLAPVELAGLLRPAGWAALALFLLGGIGPHVYSPSAAWHRGLAAVGVLAAGILGGAVVTPAILPWIPARAFSAKGALVGGIAAVGAAVRYRDASGIVPLLPLLLALPAVSSFAAMHFTGSTPFTSPSGVEKEMRRAIPVQAALAALAGILWVGGAFLR